ARPPRPTPGEPMRPEGSGEPRRGAPVGWDVGRVRALYPALADGYAYLDGAAGTQVPGAVIEAIAGACAGGVGTAGGPFPGRRRAGESVAEARRAVADLVGGEQDGVVLGANMTTLT